MILERVGNAILLAIIILVLIVIGLSILNIAGSNAILFILGLVVLLAAYLLYKRGA